nr:leucine-rich repeat extensin-like protein 3 [Ipomoea batatas]
MEVVKPTKFSFFTLNWLCFLLGTMVPGLKSQSPGSLVCISDCATCPIICSSPPPQLEAVSVPPPPLPPLLAYGPPPPPPPLPPSSYISWDGATTPASPSNYLDSPPATETPPAGGGLGKINYSYPYFYYFASNDGTGGQTNIMVPIRRVQDLVRRKQGKTVVVEDRRRRRRRGCR